MFRHISLVGLWPAILSLSYTWCSYPDILGNSFVLTCIHCIVFKKVLAINIYYYFRFESSDPGAGCMRQSAVGKAETRFDICMTPLLEMDSENITRVIPPAGLSDERRRYLFKHERLPVLHCEYFAFTLSNHGFVLVIYMLVAHK